MFLDKQRVIHDLNLMKNNKINFVDIPCLIQLIIDFIKDKDETITAEEEDRLLKTLSTDFNITTALFYKISILLKIEFELTTLIINKKQITIYGN